MKNIFMLTAVLFIFTACSEVKVPLYPDETQSTIYLQFDGSYDNNFSSGVISNRNFLDSAIFSLANYPISVTSVVQSFPVKIMGNVTNYDRKVKFKINEELTTARLGEDFDIELDTTYLKAGANKTSIRVRLHRNARTLKEKVRVAIELLENEHFIFSMREYKGNENPNVNSPTFNAQIGKIIFSDIITEPFAYMFAADSYFGIFSVNKMTILNALMGWTPADWEVAGMAGSIIQASKYTYAAFALRDELQARADAGKPERDDKGNFLQLANKYAVDYSAYQ